MVVPVGLLDYFGARIVNLISKRSSSRVPGRATSVLDACTRSRPAISEALSSSAAVIFCAHSEYSSTVPLYVGTTI